MTQNSHKNSNNTQYPNEKTQEIVNAIRTDPSILNNEEIQHIVYQQMKIHSGPLPSPEDINLYNQYIPDGANRIMSMAEKSLSLKEKEQNFAYELNKEGLKIQKRGQWFALSIVIIFFILSLIIASHGDTMAAAILMGGVGLAGIVTAIMMQKKK
ncbi:DUF2335 domain-containing protein [Basilea psittacipulmonis]|uniref:DUF2335 domain-containing protein n=1 Tax=Basilea psittacipulmonis TaxID=1472345 RepID=UPI0006908FEF|nr:DUF2335 domain-containing protein [Basilea psittacipulmonis]